MTPQRRQLMDKLAEEIPGLLVDEDPARPPVDAQECCGKSWRQCDCDADPRDEDELRGGRW